MANRPARKAAKKEEGKKRSIKVIFGPLSVLFYAGVGYVIYRQVRKRREHKQQLPQGA